MDTTQPIGYNVDCPVCSEPNDLFALNCLHLIHLDCAKNMISLKCPICKADMENLPEDISQQIQLNEKKYYDEMEEEERAALIQENSRIEDVVSRMEYHINPNPQIEMGAAAWYLFRRGVPARYIPKEISIKIPEGQPRPPPGTWFQTAVGQAYSRMKEDAELSDTDSSDDSESDNENPFDVTALEDALPTINFVNGR